MWHFLHTLIKFDNLLVGDIMDALVKEFNALAEFLTPGQPLEEAIRIAVERWDEGEHGNENQ